MVLWNPLSIWRKRSRRKKEKRKNGIGKSAKKSAPQTTNANPQPPRTRTRPTHPPAQNAATRLAEQQRPKRSAPSAPVRVVHETPSLSSSSSSFSSSSSSSSSADDSATSYEPSSSGADGSVVENSSALYLDLLPPPTHNGLEAATTNSQLNTLQRRRQLPPTPGGTIVAVPASSRGKDDDDGDNIYEDPDDLFDDFADGDIGSPSLEVGIVTEYGNSFLERPVLVSPASNDSAVPGVQPPVPAPRRCKKPGTMQQQQQTDGGAIKSKERPARTSSFQTTTNARKTEGTPVTRGASAPSAKAAATVSTKANLIPSADIVTARSDERMPSEGSEMPIRAQDKKEEECEKSSGGKSSTAGAVWQDGAVSGNDRADAAPAT